MDNPLVTKSLERVEQEKKCFVPEFRDFVPGLSNGDTDI
jgi:hypothetical protein